ncbi:LuxR C-terminal-related transcriptional regulator [Enterococcus olivae]
MENISKNDLLLLNNMIHHIYSCENSNEMRKQLLQKISLLISFTGGNFYLADVLDHTKLSSPISYDLPAEFCTQYIENYQNLDYSRGLLFTGKSIVYRESDILPDNQRIETPYYKIFYAKYDFHHSLHISISNHQQFLGVLSLFRHKKEPNFSQYDLTILTCLIDHLEFRLFQDHQKLKLADQKRTVHQTAEYYDLTKREEKVLRLLIDGLENQEICDLLCITNNTLKKHILNLYRKMNINNRVQLFKSVKEKEE